MSHPSEQPEYRRLFTLAEARGALSGVSTLLEQIRDVRGRVEQTAIELGTIDQLKRQNGGRQRAERLESDINNGVLALNKLVRALHDTGVVLKDPDQGIVDFPHLRDGRVVFLCYRVGEADIRYWHEVDEGFAGRQPLEGA